MSSRKPENPDQTQPRGGLGSDSGASMKRDLNVPRSMPADLTTAGLDDPKTADEALIAWDELDAQLLQMLAEDPERGRRLRKLQDADGWLRARAAEAARKTGGPALLDCPEAEELYDFGQGPGATTLSQARQDAIDRHLATCRECEAFVETLSVPMPAGLELGMPDEEPEELPVDPAWVRPTPVIPLRRKGPRRLLVGAGLAAAAVVVALIAIQTQSAPGLAFPQQPPLRGSAGGPIFYPRGHVLAPSEELKKVFPALGGRIEWLIEPSKDATEYQFLWIRHDDSAFAKELGRGRFDSKDSSGFISQLDEGSYTLFATAIVNGLPHPMTPREFDVQTDPAIEAQLLATRGQPTIERTMTAIRLLQAAKYWTDARDLARSLPPSPERDLFLSQTPGR